MLINEILEAIISSHVIGGFFGGLSRSLSIEESRDRMLVSSFVGAVSGAFLTPMLVWGIGRFLLETTEADVLPVMVQGGIAFCVGMVGKSLSGVVELFFERLLSGLMKK